MAEVKTYTREARTYTVYGGKRDTTYDNFEQAVKRMKSLHKKGARLTYGWYELDRDRFVFGMTTYDPWCDIKTPGQQWSEHNTYNGKHVIIMHMMYANDLYTCYYRQVEVA